MSNFEKLRQKIAYLRELGDDDLADELQESLEEDIANSQKIESTEREQILKQKQEVEMKPTRKVNAYDPNLKFEKEKQFKSIAEKVFLTEHDKKSLSVYAKNHSNVDKYINELKSDFLKGLSLDNLIDSLNSIRAKASKFYTNEFLPEKEREKKEKEEQIRLEEIRRKEVEEKQKNIHRDSQIEKPTSNLNVNVQQEDDYSDIDDDDVKKALLMTKADIDRSNRKPVKNIKIQDENKRPTSLKYNEIISEGINRHQIPEVVEKLKSSAAKQRKKVFDMYKENAEKYKDKMVVQTLPNHQVLSTED